MSNAAMMKVMWVVIALVLVGAAVYAAGHYKKTSSPSPSPTPTVSPTPKPTPTPTPVATSAAITECTTANLSGSLDATGGGTAGTQYQQLILTNKGTVSCTLYGFPGVSLVNAAGAQLGSPAARSGLAGLTITLAPGHAAASAVGFPDAGNFAPGQCSAMSTGLKAYPPNQTQALLIPLQAQACPGFSVQTLVTH